MASELPSQPAADHAAIQRNRRPRHRPCSKDYVAVALGIWLAKPNTDTSGDSRVYDGHGNGLARSGHRFSGGHRPVRPAALTSA